MLTERQGYQIQMHSVTIEDLVPECHLLRKVERLVKWGFIYEAVRGLYSDTVGRPSIDPVMLVKYLLVGFLYGIESERRIEQEIEVNMAYRWFLGLDIGERMPDHSTISQNRRRRYNGTGLFRQIFEEIVRQCMEKGLVEGKVILTDSTHVKANGSRRQNIRACFISRRVRIFERIFRQTRRFSAGILCGFQGKATQYSGKFRRKDVREGILNRL